MEEYLSTSGAEEELVAKNLATVKEKITAAFKKLPGDKLTSNCPPRLVAVSKTKPVELILKAYHEGQRHFGENYVQSLLEKAQDPRLSGLDGIKWHFVGHLQRNKCNNLTSCPNLWVVETVGTERLASALDTSYKRINEESQLRVFVQINTSGEVAKSGCLPEEVISLVKYINENCSNLMFCGLMTIGRIGHDYSSGPNPDFECLQKVHRTLCDELKLLSTDVELSMGMSADFEEAIHFGSTNVRVGSTIFGAREVKK